MPNMTGRPGCRTMEMNGGSSASYLTCTPCVPLFCASLLRVETEGAFRLPGEGGDHFHCNGGTFTCPVIFGVEFSCFPRKRRPQKIHRNSPPFFNAKPPGKYEKKIHKVLFSGEQPKQCKKYRDQKRWCPKWPFWKHDAPHKRLVEVQCAHRKHCHPETSLGRQYRHPTFQQDQIAHLQSSHRQLHPSIFRKRRGVQKSMGNKVPWKTGMLIYLAVSSRPLIFLQTEALLSPCNFKENLGKLNGFFAQALQSRSRDGHAEKLLEIHKLETPETP